MSKYSKWITANYTAAKEATAGTGIYPEILLSQAIIESAKNGVMPGTALARNHNNYFGIKAGKSYTGRTVLMVTKEHDKDGSEYTENASFRAYSAPVESFKDYVQFLQKNKRYSKAIKAGSIEAQAQELQAAGYSTNSKYAAIVGGMARTIKNALGAAAGTIKSNQTEAALVGLSLLAGLVYLNKSTKNGR